MSEPRPIRVAVVIQGGPVMNEDASYVMREGDGIALVQIDMQTKRSVVAITGDMDGMPQLAVYPVKGSLHQNESQKGTMTLLQFPDEFKGWRVELVEQSRYLIMACLVREDVR